MAHNRYLWIFIHVSSFSLGWWYWLSFTINLACIWYWEVRKFKAIFLLATVDLIRKEGMECNQEEHWKSFEPWSSGNGIIKWPQKVLDQSNNKTSIQINSCVWFIRSSLRAVWEFREEKQRKDWWREEKKKIEREIIFFFG